MIHIPPLRILVPLDFSEPSFTAWNFAKALAKRTGAIVEGIYADDAVVLEMPPFEKRPMNAVIYREIENHLRWRIGKDDRIDIIEGAPVPVILRTARRRRTDLIVMGTHGRTGVPRVMFGSVTEAVTRTSPAPVITIRKKWRSIGNILAPINFKKYSIKGFFAAAEYARELGASIDFLYVEHEKPTKAAAQAMFKALLLRLPRYFHEGRAPNLIIRRGNPVVKIVAESRGYDLIALVAHRKSIFEDFVLGTTVERVLRHSPVPVLSLPSVQPRMMPGLEKVSERALAAR